MNKLIKRESLLPAHSEQAIQSRKCTTALSALRSPSPILSAVNREEGPLEYNIGLAYIVAQLFKVRYSKQDISPQMVDEFGVWLLTDYYFLNYQEVELALMSYRGPTFHVIDLEALKVMIEEYCKQRAEACEIHNKEQVEEEAPEDIDKYIASELDRVSGYNRYPMPQKTKDLINKLLIRSNINQRIKPKERIITIEDLFDSQQVNNITETETGSRNIASEIREQWSKDWRSIKEEADRMNIGIESKEIYLRKKESYFILSQTRAVPLNK